MGHYTDRNSGLVWCSSLTNQNTCSIVEVSIILELSPEIVNQTILVRQQHKIKLPDAIIAATAIIYDFILITRNVSDFKGIKGLVIVDPNKL